MSTYQKESIKNNITLFDKCANCGACYNACPRRAITVKDDFFYSVTVEEDKCINCGKCVSVCPVNSYKKVQNITLAYSAEHISNEVIKSSSSGGAFTAFADYIIKKGGVVWGAGYSEGYDKVIFRSTIEVDLDSLRRSKYVESLVGDSFTKIKKLLDSGSKVLFCGTPCQAAGLKRFIGEHENLYILDFSCGGLISNNLYQQWLNSLKEKYKSEVNSVNFRSKYFGWGIHCVTVNFKNNKRYLKAASLDPYFSSFISGNLSVREYCYECQFSDNHYADIVLADYWKYKDTYPTANNKGISLILANSLKGEALIQSVSDTLKLIPLDINKATYNIKETKKSEQLYKKRAEFLKMAKKEGLDKASKIYCLPNKIKRLRYLLMISLKKITRC